MSGADDRPHPRPLAIANRHPRLQLDRPAIARAIAELDAHAEEFRGGAPAGELSLVFLTDAALAKLHADFLADPSITDVITFMGEPALGSAGEICVSVDAARRHVAKVDEASSLVRPKAGQDASSTSARFATELTLYLVHGWLHLAGYDDLEPTKKRAMRRAEARAMKLLRGSRSLPRFRLAS